MATQPPGSSRRICERLIHLCAPAGTRGCRRTPPHLGAPYKEGEGFNSGKSYLFFQTLEGIFKEMCLFTLLRQWNDLPWDSQCVSNFHKKCETKYKYKAALFHFNFHLSPISMTINVIAYCRKCIKFQGSHQNHAYGHMGTMKLILMKARSGKKYIILIKLTSSLPSQREVFKNYLR